MTLTDPQYQLIVATGRVATSARALLVWLHDRANANRCRCCDQDAVGWAEHDPSLPCGALRDDLKALGAAVRAVTVDLDRR